jgi:hypothetical protein
VVYSIQRNFCPVFFFLAVCAWFVVFHTPVHGNDSKGVVTVFQEIDAQNQLKMNSRYRVFSPTGHGLVIRNDKKATYVKAHILCMDGTDVCKKQRYWIKRGVHTNYSIEEKPISDAVIGSQCAPLLNTKPDFAMSCTFAIAPSTLPVAPIGISTKSNYVLVNAIRKEVTVKDDNIFFKYPIIGKEDSATMNLLGLPVYNDRGAIIGLVSDNPTICGYDARCKTLPIALVTNRGAMPAIRTATADHNAISTVKNMPLSIVKTRIQQMRNKCKNNKNYIKYYVLSSSSCALIAKQKPIAALQPSNTEDVRYAQTIVQFSKHIKS